MTLRVGTRLRTLPISHALTRINFVIAQSEAVAERRMLHALRSDGAGGTHATADSHR